MMADLDKMVQNALDQFPALAYKNGGSRAHAGADLVDQVRHIRDDIYDVHGHHCSFGVGWCDCRDSKAPDDPKLGKLCKHRLALLFWFKMAAERVDAITQALREALAADAGRVTLIESRYYGDYRNENQHILDGWRIVGEGETVLPYEERLRFTPQLLRDALDAAGWRLDSQTRQGYPKWHIYCVPQDNPQLDSADLRTRIRILDNPDATDVHRKRDLTIAQSWYGVGTEVTT